MNVSVIENIWGRLAVLTPNRGKIYDWGFVTIFEETLLLKDGDLLSKYDKFGSLQETVILEFDESDTYSLGQNFRRRLVNNHLENLFLSNAYVKLTRDYADVGELVDPLE